MAGIRTLPAQPDPRAYGYKDFSQQIEAAKFQRETAKDRYEVQRNAQKDASEADYRNFERAKGTQESQLQAAKYGFERQKYDQETTQKRDAENFVYKSLYGKTKDDLIAESKNPAVVPIKEPMPNGRLNGKQYGFKMGNDFTPQTSRVVGERVEVSPALQKFKENPILPSGLRPEITPKDRYEMSRDRAKDQKAAATAGVEENRRALSARASIIRAQMNGAMNSGDVEAYAKHSGELDKIDAALKAGPQTGYRAPEAPPEAPASGEPVQDTSLNDFNSLYKQADDEEKAFIDRIPGGPKEKLAEIARRMPRQ